MFLGAMTGGIPPLPQSQPIGNHERVSAYRDGMKAKLEQFRTRFEQSDLDDPKIVKRINLGAKFVSASLVMATGGSISFLPLIPVQGFTRDGVRMTQTLLREMTRTKENGQTRKQRVWNAVKLTVFNELTSDKLGARFKSNLQESIINGGVDRITGSLGPVGQGPVAKIFKSMITDMMFKSVNYGSMKLGNGPLIPALGEVAAASAPAGDAGATGAPTVEASATSIPVVESATSAPAVEAVVGSASAVEVAATSAPAVEAAAASAPAGDAGATGAPTVETATTSIPVVEAAVTSTGNENVRSKSNSVIAGHASINNKAGNIAMETTARNYQDLTAPSFSNRALYDEDIEQVIRKLQDSVTTTNNEIHMVIDQCKDIVSAQGNQSIKNIADELKSSFNDRIVLLKQEFDNYSNEYRQFIQRYHEEEAEKDEHEQLIRQTEAAFDGLKSYSGEILSMSADTSREGIIKDTMDSLSNAAVVCEQANDELYKMLLSFVQDKEIESVAYGICNYAVPFMMSVDNLVEDLHMLSKEGEMKRQERSEEAKKFAESAAEVRIAATNKAQVERSNKAKALLSTWGQKRK
ncbi:hypothetical protein [Paenibacillus odorifer]|uniref:Uncharacterized protein n=1 Tax=Paenibacillus odorifer TaxID=189426 RepID=A0A1R0Y9K3_9BACL|nr:hypothetical protein [Paenibacillus odorifer]OMD44058.1 hypothetical protein BSK52_00465 [Paenibacillus odorifer]